MPIIFLTPMPCLDIYLPANAGINIVGVKKWMGIIFSQFLVTFTNVKLWFLKIIYLRIK